MPRVHTDALSRELHRGRLGHQPHGALRRVVGPVRDQDAAPRATAATASTMPW
jgi:hypothetical protein